MNGHLFLPKDRDIEPGDVILDVPQSTLISDSLHDTGLTFPLDHQPSAFFRLVIKLLLATRNGWYQHWLATMPHLVESLPSTWSKEQLELLQKVCPLALLHQTKDEGRYLEYFSLCTMPWSR